MKFYQLLVVSFLFLTANQAFAKSSALVIGINDYKNLEPLRGAVNDAKLIRDALKSRNIEVTMLVDNFASKQAIYNNWLNMLANARKGDTLIFTYSGHGGFEKDEDNEPNETNGKDQNFLLSNFAKGPYAKTSDFRIVDDEIHDWFFKAKKKGVKIIFVADSCYSGSMTRSLKSEHAHEEYDLSDEDLPPPNLLSNKRNKRLVDDDLKHVVFFYSSSDKLTTPEYNIDGEPHGMLSWAFANAISGKADSDGSGALTKRELDTYMKEIILNKTHSIQVIGSKPKGSGDVVLFPKKQLTQKQVGNNKLPSLLVLGKLPKGRLQSFKRANNQASADLIWNVKKGIVKNNVQDTITHDIDSIRAMQGVIDKWQLLNYLQQHIISGHYAKSELIQRRNPSHIGDRVTFKIAQIRYPYLTQFNLAGNGALQFLYPTKPEDFNKRIGASFSMGLDVSPPVGGDQLVSIFSNKPLKKLHKELSTNDQSIKPLSIQKVLSSSLKGVDYQISTIGLYTVKR